MPILTAIKLSVFAAELSAFSPALECTHNAAKCSAVIPANHCSVQTALDAAIDTT